MYMPRPVRIPPLYVCVYLILVEFDVSADHVPSDAVNGVDTATFQIRRSGLPRHRSTTSEQPRARVGNKEDGRSLPNHVQGGISPRSPMLTVVHQRRVHVAGVTRKLAQQPAREIDVNGGGRQRRPFRRADGCRKLADVEAFAPFGAPRVNKGLR